MNEEEQGLKTTGGGIQMPDPSEFNFDDFDNFEAPPIEFASNEIVVEEKKEVVKDVIPAFDTTILEDLPEEERKGSEEQLIHSMKKEPEREKDNFKSNIIFIIIFFAVMIFAVLFIFPLLAGV